MRAYWDSSALLAATRELKLRERLDEEKGFSRKHALAEVFSALTGKPHLRLLPSHAARLIRSLARDLEFVDLGVEEILESLDEAEKLGVRGGRVHDLLHARAAIKGGARELLTLDQNDFAGLAPGLIITQV
ncbi:MAG TPA: hypothetical protein VFC07_11440 [Verrucomicrobiae bacterium]|nr:hypothetical protein [Verrucomicrobiae bacterium]